MSDLTGQEIKETYKDLLHMNNGNTGVTSDLSRVFDGEGTGSALYLSDTEASVMGNVGIGTTSPKSELHIESNVANHDTTLKIENRHGDTGGTAIEFQGYRDVDNDHWVAKIVADHVSSTQHGSSAIGSKLNFHTFDGVAGFDSPRMTIDQNGKVGIGTTSPSAKLDINIAANTNGLVIREDADDSITHNLFVDGNGDGQAIFYADGQNAKISLNTSGNSYFNGGNVGIGTASPSVKLQVNGDILAVGANVSVSNGGSASGVGMYSPASNEMGLCTNSTEAIRIDSAGNIGIGTSPNEKLSIYDSSDPTIDLKNTTTQALAAISLVDEGSTNGALAFKTRASGSSPSTRMYIDSSGKVGIGTTDPTHPLEIKAAQGQFGCHVVDDQGASYGGLYVQSNGGTGSGLALYLKEPAGQTKARISADSVNPSFIQGKFGIGTVSPIYALDVSNNLSLTLGADDPSGSTRANNTNKSSRIGGVNYNNSNDPVNMMMHVSKAAESLLYFGWGTGAMVCPTKIVFGTASNTNTSSADSAANQRMVIDSAGDVLVNYNLDVLGDVSKSGGNFKIDHPLPEKSETHHLVHSFIEGPQADNIYRGKVELVAGKAEVNIDTVSGMTEGTFVALNRDIQTFTSNESDWDAVRGKVEGNKLIIECQNTESTATVSWLVIGERQDEHMFKSKTTDDNGKLIVEPLKPEPEPEYVEEEPVVEEALEEPVAEEAPVEEPQPEEVAAEEPQVAQVSLGQVSLEQVSLGQVSLGQVSLGQVSLSESPLEEIREIRAEDGKEYVRIGDKEYEVLGKNEDGSLLLDDDTTNNG